MATRRAKILDDFQFAKLLHLVSQGDHPLRDQVMILLSYKAGLRAQEIAGLEWTDVCDAEMKVRTDFIFIPSDIAKKGRERQVPLNPHLHTALQMLRASRPDDQYVIYAVAPPPSKRYRRRCGEVRKRLSPSGVAMWFRRLYQRHGFEQCSSHSGRRTFITRLARRAGQHDCSIKDVQMLAGHAHLSTTEAYIEPSPNVGRLVSAI